jgi:hypothetical protein
VREGLGEQLDQVRLAAAEGKGEGRHPCGVRDVDGSLGLQEESTDDGVRTKARGGTNCRVQGSALSRHERVNVGVVEEEGAHDVFAPVVRGDSQWRESVEGFL